jgi:hypothetical protein
MRARTSGARSHDTLAQPGELGRADHAHQPAVVDHGQPCRVVVAQQRRRVLDVVLGRARDRHRSVDLGDRRAARQPSGDGAHGQVALVDHAAQPPVVGHQDVGQGVVPHDLGGLGDRGVHRHGLGVRGHGFFDCVAHGRPPSPSTVRPRCPERRTGMRRGAERMNRARAVHVRRSPG